MIAVRDAGANDADAVRATITASFGRSDEADLVSHLLAETVVLASLVACDDTGVIGYVLFSEVRIDGDRPGTLARAIPGLDHGRVRA